MRELIKTLLCRILGWHDYRFTLTHPPVGPDETLMFMVEENKCSRCGKNRDRIVWHWDKIENDFHSMEVGWLMDQPVRNNETG